MQLNYFFFGKSQDLISHCTESLSVKPRHTFVASKRLLHAARMVLPDFIVIDYKVLNKETLRLLSRLRIQTPAASIPFVVIVELEDIEQAEQEALYHFSQSIIIGPNHIKTQLTVQLEMILESHFTERTEQTPHPYGLEILARVWRQGLNGDLILVGTNETVEMMNGGINTINAISLLQKGLLGRGFVFNESMKSGLGDWLSVGNLLWNAATKRTEVGFLRQRMNLELTPTAYSNRCVDIDIPDILKPILRSKSKQSIRETLKDHGIRHTQVENSIEALYILGLYGFEWPPEGTETLDFNPNSPGVLNPSSEKQHISTLQSKLYLELSALQQFDEWQTLGLTPGLNITRIKDASEARRTPYLEWSQSAPGVHSRKLAYKLLQQIDNSANCAIELAHCYRSFGYKRFPYSSEEELFQAGHRALLQRRYSSAFRCFQDAIQFNLMSARLLSYAGWSAFHLGHYSLALEQLDIARIHAPRHPFVLRCFTLVNIQLKNLNLAENALSIMFKHGIDIENANQLKKIMEHQQKSNEPIAPN